MDAWFSGRQKSCFQTRTYFRWIPSLAGDEYCTSCVKGKRALIGGHAIGLDKAYDSLPLGAKIEIGETALVSVAAVAQPPSAKIDIIDDLGRVRFARRIGDRSLQHACLPGFQCR